MRCLSAALNGLSFGLAGVWLMLPDRPDLPMYVFALLEGTVAVTRPEWLNWCLSFGR